MTLNRRRFLSISGAALTMSHGAAAKAVEARWQGVALGARASVMLAGVDQVDARSVFAELEATLARLEGIFSLYRDDSAITRLNRDGHLAAPPPEILEVLSIAGRLHAGSEGAFDPTIQPLWRAMAFGGNTDDALNRIGWSGMSFDTNEIRFHRPGMALTLNGIAQGYVTDSIAALLKREGFGNVLVDIGEIAASGHNPDGATWTAGIADVTGRIVNRVSLRDQALATSAPKAMILPDGVEHILNPLGNTPRHRLVSVSAPKAVLSDGLSTALCLLDQTKGKRLVGQFDGAKIEFVA